MNFEDYIREMNSKGVKSFLITVKKADKYHIEAFLKPIVWSKKFIKDILIKNNEIEFGTDIRMHIKNIMQKQAERGEFIRINKRLDNWIENEEDYTRRVIHNCNEILIRQGHDKMKEYLERIDVELMPGPNFDIEK